MATITAAVHHCPLCDKALTHRAAGTVSHFRMHVRRGELAEVGWSPEGTEFAIPDKTTGFVMGYSSPETKDKWFAHNGIAGLSETEAARKLAEAGGFYNFTHYEPGAAWRDRTIIYCPLCASPGAAKAEPRYDGTPGLMIWHVYQEKPYVSLKRSCFKTDAAAAAARQAEEVSDGDGE
jgi:hypothetical protein